MEKWPAQNRPDCRLLFNKKLHIVYILHWLKMKFYLFSELFVTKYFPMEPHLIVLYI